MSELKLSQFKALLFDVYATLIVSLYTIRNECFPTLDLVTGLGEWHLRCLAPHAATHQLASS